MSRDARQWNDYRAHIKITEGDPAECHKWYGIAINRLKFLLAHRPGSVTDAMAPSDGVYIRVDTKPNRIYIKVEGGGVFPTVMNPTGTASAYPTGLIPPYQKFRERRVYKALTHTIINDLYAGGPFDTHVSVSPPSVNGTVPGGYWHNNKDKAISWHARPNSVMYIGERFGIISTPASGDYVASACFTTNTVWQTVSGLTSTFPYVVLVAFSNSTSAKFQLRGYTVLKTGATTDGITLTQFFNTTYTGTFVGLINFKSDGSGIFQVYRGSTSGLSSDFLRTKIDRHDLAANLASITTTTIYNKVEQGVYDDALTASTYPLTVDWRTTGTGIDVLRTLKSVYDLTEDRQIETYDNSLGLTFTINTAHIANDGTEVNGSSYGTYSWSDVTEYSATVVDGGTAFAYNSAFSYSNITHTERPYIFDYNPKSGVLVILLQVFDQTDTSSGTSLDEFETYSISASESYSLIIVKNGIVLSTEVLHTGTSSSSGTRSYTDPALNNPTGATITPSTPIYERVTGVEPLSARAIGPKISFDVVSYQPLTGGATKYWTLSVDRVSGAHSLVAETGDITTVSGHPYDSQIAVTQVTF